MLQDWKFKNTSELLFSQIKILIQFNQIMEDIRVDLQSLADNIANLYSQKEIPVYKKCENDW